MKLACCIVQILSNSMVRWVGPRQHAVFKFTLFRIFLSFKCQLFTPRLKVSNFRVLLSLSREGYCGRLWVLKLYKKDSDWTPCTCELCRREGSAVMRDCLVYLLSCNATIFTFFFLHLLLRDKLRNISLRYCFKKEWQNSLNEFLDLILVSWIYHFMNSCSCTS